jgi:hypothetical protein
MIYEHGDPQVGYEWHKTISQRYVVYLSIVHASGGYAVDTWDEIKPEHQPLCALLDAASYTADKESYAIVSIAKILGVGEAKYYRNQPPVYYLDLL